MAAFTLGAMGLQAQESPGFVNTLMPQPAHLSAGSGELDLSTGFTTVTDKSHDERLDAAISRALMRLKNKTGLEIATMPAATGTGTLTITVDGPGEAIQSLDENEDYSLEVSSNAVHLKATTDVGAMHGLETLLQLVQPGKSGYFLPAVTINDSPRFRWRGLMIDVSRHFEPVSVIERNLDAMAEVKLNVFHWHLTDDQGVRIESKVFPKLTSMGSDGLYYTQDQAREVIEYARARGIRVVPEFDIPGHTNAWFPGYPELASADGPFHVMRNFGVNDPVMDPTKESTYKFLDKFIGEMAALFPDPYMHIGGDENNGKEWASNPKIQEFMKAHNLQGTAALQTYFNQKLGPILKKHNKIMIGWDEIYAPGLQKDAVIHSWRGFDSLAATAKDGYRGILSAGYYLDQIDSAGKHYLVDPVPADTTLTPEQSANILGGEATIWGEHVGPLTIDSRTWPRTAAIAERLWSPQNVRDVDDMYRRLWVESLRLEQLGLTHISHQDVALRQLAGTPHTAPLQVLASIMQPVQFHIRYQLQHTDQVTPLDHFIDAIRPDPPSQHELPLLVKQYLSKQGGTEAGEDLEVLFEQWISATPEAEQLIANSPLLAEVQPRAQQMGELGTTGLQALDYLKKGKTAPADWVQSRLAMLDDAKKPAGLVRFTVLDPIKELVEAAGGQK